MLCNVELDRVIQNFSCLPKMLHTLLLCILWMLFSLLKFFTLFFSGQTLHSSKTQLSPPSIFKNSAVMLQTATSNKRSMSHTNQNVTQNQISSVLFLLGAVDWVDGILPVALKQLSYPLFVHFALNIFFRKSLFAVLKWLF